MSAPHTGSKHRVIQQSLEFLAEFAPISEARVATMGGAGLEAEVWRTLHIPPHHAWLVEHDRAKLRGLKKMYRDLHFSRELKQFPQDVERVLGERAHLDLFHLDLCGTVEPSIRDLTGVLPLLLTGKGRVLAVTIADQRGSRALNESKFVQKVCERIFGKHWAPLWDNLIGLHQQEPSIKESIRADPDKVALREVCALLYLLLAFTAVRKEGSRYEARTTRFPLMHFLRFRDNGERKYLKLIEQGTAIVMPDRLQRFVYWSDTRHFRMRTFLFHLADCAEPVDVPTAAARLAKLVMHAPFSIVDGTDITSVWHQSHRGRPRPTQQMTTETTAVAAPPADHADNQESTMPAKSPPVIDTMTEVAAIKQRFAPFLGAMNPEMQADFNSLCDLAQAAPASSAIMSAACEVVAASERLKRACGIMLIGAAAAPVSPSTDVPAASPRHRADGTPKRKSTSRAVPPVATPATTAMEREQRKPSPTTAKGVTLGKTALTIEASDDMRLMLLRGRHQGTNTYRALRDQWIKEYGVEGAPVKPSQISNLLANTGGLHRSGFLARVVGRKTTTKEQTELLEELAILFGAPVKNLRVAMKRGQQAIQKP